MFEIIRVAEIKAPAAVVWEVITDLARYPEWNPFCLTCESTLKPSDPITMTVKLTAKPQKQVETMLEYVEGRRFAYCMRPVPGMLSSYRSHEVEALGAERTRYTSTFQLKQWFRVVVLAFLQPRLEAGFAGMTEAVQRRAEALWAARKP